MEEKDPLKKRFILFIIVSLFLHLTLLVSFYEIPFFRSEAPAPPPKQEVVFVRPQDLRTGPPQGLELADLAKPKVQKVPKKARFASQYNSAVKKETVARKVPKKARVEVEVSEAPKRKKKATVDGRRSTVKKRVEGPVKKGSAPKELSLSDLQVKTSDFKDLIKEHGNQEGKKDAKAVDRRRDLAMVPRPSDLAGPGDRFVHDFMPNVKIGDKTYLNAHALPNVQYFTRLKRIFRLRFNPAPPLISYFRSNRVVVGKVNVTMAMEVSRRGTLKKLFVVKSSGIPGYDQEALRTVRQSSPFSAPPKKVLSKDGVLRMTWHFTTYL